MVLDLHAEGAAVWGGGGSWSPNQEMRYSNPQKNIIYIYISSYKVVHPQLQDVMFVGL